jgi:hypothetical protein
MVKMNYLFKCNTWNVLSGFAIDKRDILLNLGGNMTCVARD